MISEWYHDFVSVILIYSKCDVRMLVPLFHGSLMWYHDAVLWCNDAVMWCHDAVIWCHDDVLWCQDAVLIYQDDVTVIQNLPKCDVRILSPWYQNASVWCLNDVSVTQGCYKCDVRILSFWCQDAVILMSECCQCFVSMMSVLGAVSVQSLLKYNYSMLLMNWQNTSSLLIASKCVLILPWL